MQIALPFSMKYFDYKVYVLGVELKHECSFYFLYNWYSILFYAKQYYLVYYDEQQMYLVTLWSAWIFQCINSLNIIQFTVKMRSNKNHIMRHSRKKFCGWRVFPSTLGCWQFLLIMDTAFTLRLNLQNSLTTIHKSFQPYAQFLE